MARRRLTKRQRERIAQVQEERRDRLARQALNASEGEEVHQGRVISRHGQHLLVQAVNGQQYHCLFRQNLGEIVCGDKVLWQPVADDQGVVVSLLPRNTVLSRPDYSGRDKPLAANITRLVVVLAPRPPPTGYLTDQYLIAAELIGVNALITLNKADLLSPDEWQAFQQEFSRYENIGYPVISVSAKKEHGLEPLLEHLKGQTSILVGQSGVGKSSLINAILPHRDEAVGALSETSGLGRHTTSVATLHFLDNGAEIIDSPGVRSFRLGKIDRRELETGFREFSPYLGKCRFSNCRHRNEPGCALIEAVEAGNIHPERLKNFLHMAEQLD
ncbi:small ribosomal subunit biogenesis GTPase RsgA [Thiolapillus brandeum]|uniref:Small ribosomal subunit biogenesis GTPase RsgA n=1 Tax=Thiolapillus brandeum TaxID=1076588 RepID=A0A7U6GIY8_9GAMM|nr:small ribosomal subunit biogenesis GTPase RsgA [Thiolapillus brandeum]BAO44442.1 ribosome-associated GTPase [Thiolapillus brandeum]